MSSERIVKKLNDLLERQATCLTGGDIDGAFAVAPAIERLVDRLETAKTPAPSVVSLQKSAARNAGLIEAAQRGIETARDALGQSDKADGFHSYDAHGRATRIGS